MEEGTLMGKKLMDMSPGERRNAITKAMKALETELQANAPLIADILAEDNCDCGESDVYDGYAECSVHPSE
jgi:hypothetical protein